MENTDQQNTDTNQIEATQTNTDPQTETKQKKKKIVKKKVSKNENENIKEDQNNTDEMNEVFSSSRQDNAKRIVDQIGEIQNNADEYIFNLISTMQNFEKVKKNLNNKYNYFFRTLFSFLGYNYISNITKVNFFIFSTQAWFIEFAKILEKKYNEIKVLESSKIITFANVLAIMKEERVSENDYLTNLGILTSSIFNQNALTSLIIENNIGKTFLNQLNILLHEIKDYESAAVDKKAFDDIVSDIFKHAVERTLNHMENQFSENPEFINFVSIFDELNKKGEHSFEDMFERVKDVEKKDSINLYSLRISTESFYDYARVKLDDIISDINLFTNNYTSIMFKTKKLLGQGLNNVKEYNQRFFELARRAMNLLENTRSNLINIRKEGLNKFYNLYNNVKGMGNELVDKINYKKWIQNTNILTDDVKEYTRRLIYDNPMKIYNIYVTNYVAPIVQSSLNKTEGIRRYLSAEWEMSMDEYQNLKKNISNYIKSKYDTASINLQKLFLVTNEDGKVRLRFSDKLEFLNPYITFDIFNKVEEYAKNFRTNVGELIERGREYSIQKINDVKEYSFNIRQTYIERFRSLLQIKEKN